MKERPIIFSNEMVRAILEGRKTQTRRVVKPQPPEWVNKGGYSFFTPDDHISFRGIDPEVRPAEVFYKLRWGGPGDRLWVREIWAYARKVEPDFDVIFNEWWIEDCYPQDGVIEPGFGVIYKEMPYLDYSGKWKSPIYMPRWASRSTLEIERVRVERLQEISKHDIHAEGIIPDNTGSYCVNGMYYHVPSFAFSALWDSLHKKRVYLYENDPWVWVIEFRLLEEGDL